MEGDRYAVKWDLHRDIIMENFERMYSLNSLTDCILMAGEREIHAHKLILSSCSSYFKKLFEKTSDKVPIVVFNEITYEELRSIIEYMYRGEVTVDERTTSRILKIGKDLKIEGLVHDPKNTKEKPPANFPWENQPGYSYGTFQHPPQGYCTQNNGWNYQNYPQPAGQYTGFNNGMDLSQNYSHAPVNNYGNGMMEARPAGQVGSIGNSKGPKNAEKPSQALSRQILNLISPQKKPDTPPKRKKDECFKSPPTTRKKSGKVYTELSTATEKTPETDGSEKTLENSTQDTKQEENTETEVTQEVSNTENANEGNDTQLFTFPSLPPVNTPTPLNPTYVASTPLNPTYVASTPLNPTYVASTPLNPTYVASTPFSTEVAESIDISDIKIPLSYQENLSEYDTDNEASDSGVNTSIAGTQDDPIPEEIPRGSMDDESSGPKDMIQDRPTQEVSETSHNKGTGKKSTKEDKQDESTGGRHNCPNCMRSYKQKSHLNSHLKYECGKTPQFSCDYCPYRCKQKSALKSHYAKKHIKHFFDSINNFDP